MTSRLATRVNAVVLTVVVLLALIVPKAQGAERSEMKPGPAADARAELFRRAARMEFNTRGNVDAIWLSQFKQTDEILSLVAQLLEVRELYLDGSDVTDRGLVQVGKLKNLESLVLSATRITYAGLEHLVDLKRLRNLTLTGTDVGSASSGDRQTEKSSARAVNNDNLPLAKMKTLRFLNLSGSAFADADMAALEPLVNMDFLMLPESISDAGMVHLKPLLKLRMLDLAHTQVTDKGLDYLAGHDQLQYITLYGTRVTNAGVLKLARLKALNEVVLARTRTTRAGIEVLRQARPGIHIQWREWNEGE